MVTEKKCKICGKKATDSLEYCPKEFEKSLIRKRGYFCRNHYKILCLLVLATGKYQDESIFDDIKDYGI